MLKIRKLRAFTLVELIVVVIIVGILAGLAVVALASYIDSSRTNAMTASATQVARKISADTATIDSKPSLQAAPTISNVTVEKSVDPTKFVVLNDAVRTKATRYVCVDFSANDNPGAAGAIKTVHPVPAVLPAVNAWTAAQC